jgi:4-diphosphocytidyl-2-C-methyl-D-erythritol kinase
MTPTVLRLPAPAKLNLFLHITGRRPNGYHELQTIFQLVDLCDWLTFETTGHPHIDLISEVDIPHEHNLIMRAARLLQQPQPHRQGIRITLDKRLPMGGGMGGGSSDAATTLLALNHLWQLGLNIDQLADLALQLGADVPVFVRGHHAWAEGIGEQLTRIELPQKRYAILKPDCFIGTSDLFSQETLTRNTPVTTFAAYQSQPELFSNDCEPVARRLFPPVAQALDYLQRFGDARLTGTGACVFVALDDTINTTALLDHAPCQGWIANSVQVSPVHAQIGLM